MDKLKLTGQALGRVFNFRSGCMHTMHLQTSVAIRPNLELKTWPKQHSRFSLVSYRAPRRNGTHHVTVSGFTNKLNQWKYSFAKHCSQPLYKLELAHKNFDLHFLARFIHSIYRVNICLYFLFMAVVYL
jgi:hypothetical protein